MTEGNGLPTGWERVTLGDLTEINPRLNVASLSGVTEVSFVPMSAVEVESGRMNATETRRLDEVRRGSYTPFQEGDVLFAKITPSMENGKSAVAWSLTSGIGFGSTEWHVFRPAVGVDPKFVRYYVVQEAFRRAARGHMKGTAGQLRVPADYLRRVPLSLPPVQEQRRIVAAIEEQFARLDAGVAALERARTNLKRYRASVLKAAVEGRLTEEWREQNPYTESGSVLLERILEERRAKWEEAQLAKYAGKEQNPPKNWRSKYKEPATPGSASVPGLPDGWVWATLEHLSGASGYGTSQKCGYEVSGPPVLRIPNVSRGTLDFTDMKYATKPDELRTTDALAPNDLLVIRTNGSRSLIGRSALVRYHPERPHYFASYMIRFRILNLTGLSSWLASIWDASPIRAWIENAAATSAGQYNISIGKLNGLEIPLPPVAEQEEIVAEVERRLSVIEEVEAQVEVGLKRAARLRQSILKRAFEGKLVSQDPSDEPASVLLERIREERERSVVKKTKQTPTKKNAKEVQTSLFSTEGG